MSDEISDVKADESEVMAPIIIDSEHHAVEETVEDVEAMKKRVKEMEEEAAKIEATISGQAGTSSAKPQVVNGPDSDSRSVYVGNVDYAATAQELESFFQSCGVVNRITIVCDKFTGHPKGFAYVEFMDQESVANAMLLNESEFHSRQLKISPKRTNVPGFARGGRRFGRRRGRGRRGRRRSYHPYQ